MTNEATATATLDLTGRTMRDGAWQEAVPSLAETPDSVTVVKVEEISATLLTAPLGYLVEWTDADGTHYSANNLNGRFVGEGEDRNEVASALVIHVLKNV